MLIPIRLYDVRAGTSPDDPATATILTSRDVDAADALVRELMRRRAAGPFEQPPGFFVVPRDATQEFASVADAVSAGYELRTVLAPVEDVAPSPAPDDGEPAETPPAIPEEGAP